MTKKSENQCSIDEQNKEDVRLHYLLRKQNDINFETRRLKLMDTIEQSYASRNKRIIFEDEYYKELLDDHRNKLQS